MPVQIQTKTQAQTHDRMFAHLVRFGGQVHCIEVQRKSDLYSGRIVLAMNLLLLQMESIPVDDAAQSPRDAISASSAMSGQVVAISRGVGFSSLHDAFRSLRKDVHINRMAMALSAAVLVQKNQRTGPPDQFLAPLIASEPQPLTRDRSPWAV